MNTRLPLVLLLLCGLGQAQAQGTPQTDLPREVLSIQNQSIEVQLASTPEQRQIGLMYRENMPENQGMLFIYPDDAQRCFWMRNTPLPLTAAFIDKAGVIVKFADMSPLSEQSHCSGQAVRYVLEMQQGWFKKRGIDTGAQLSFSRCIEFNLSLVAKREAGK